jgi:ribonuclease HII
MRTENEIKEKIENTELVITLDEAAVGVLSGDLYVCGVVITKDKLKEISGLNDSKKLSEKKRAELFPQIIEKAVDYELVKMSPQEVDELNIFQARMEGFKRAINILAKRTGATYAVIDGNKKPSGTDIETDFLVKADAILPGVSCASIIAKHSHTLYINELCKQELYKKYGFKSHKGYGTKLHLEKLKEYGPIEGFHRMSYKPVKDSIK